MTAPIPQPDPRADAAVSSDLVTVFRGSQTEALVLQGVLGDADLHPYLETIDPFVAGGNIFEVELKVPAGETGAAEEAIREARNARDRADADGDEEAGSDTEEATD
jgi:hypothetical protein